MKRVAPLLAACVAVVSAIGLWAQEADSVVPAINPPAASQPVPRLIMFSGTVKDLTGKPLTGPVDLNFAIYKEQTDAAPLWQESQTLNVDEQGHYTALLGAMQPEGLPVELFTTGEARWLGVSAGNPSASSGQWLPEQPRVLLVSVPYALKANDAEMLGGKPASAYALAQPPLGPLLGKEGSGVVDRLPGGLAMPGKPKSGPKPNATGTGTQYYIPRWIDGQGTLGDSVMYQNGSNVGIGTTTPAYLLDVVGGAARVTNPSGVTQLQVSGSATSGRLGQDAAGFFFSSDTNGAALRFLTNNGGLNEWMRITSAGNVGIGTTSPTFPLSFGATTGNKLALYDSGSGVGYGLGIGASLLQIFGPNSSARVGIGYGNSSAFTETLSIKGNNVGIGTTTPAYLLDVVGGSARVTNPSGVTQLQVSGSATSGRLGQDAAGFFFSSDTNGAALRFLTNNGSLNEWMRISSAGNVGIGTATPAHVLDVVGDINASTNINAGGNLSVTGTITGNGTGLTGVPVAATANGLSCTGCVTGTEIANATITTSNIASGTITASNIAASSILPGDIAGTAATLGSNTFVGTQTVAGSLCVSGTVNGVTIVPSVTKSCTFNGTTYTCQSANSTSGFTNGGSTTTACTDPASSTTAAVLRANPVKLGLTEGKGLRPEAAAPRRTTGLVPETAATFSCPAGGNCIADNVIGGAISGGGGIVGGSAYVNRVTNHWGTVAGGARNQSGDGTDPTTSSNCCQTVGGGMHNAVTGWGSTVAGGADNNASGVQATVGGGRANTTTNDDATVAGGYGNQAQGDSSTVGGGIFNVASGANATVAGGYNNQASVNATIPGGFVNVASGYSSFAAGCYANAVNSYAFVWSGWCATLTSSASAEFVANAPGGFWLGNATTTTTATMPSNAFLYTTSGAYLSTSGVWTNNSDRNLKTAFATVDESSLLARIGQLPLTSWQYKVEPSSIRHIGPMAQDFYSAFKLGNDDKHISTVDEGGVALAGVQALYRLSLEKDAQIRKLTAEVNRLKNVERQMAPLAARLAQIEARTAKPQPRSVKRTAPAKPAPGSVTLAKAQF